MWTRNVSLFENIPLQRRVLRENQQLAVCLTGEM
jgi:hypothetical protein